MEKKEQKELKLPEVLLEASGYMNEAEQKKELPDPKTNVCVTCPLAVWYRDTVFHAYCTKMMRDNIWSGGNIPPRPGVRACSARDEALTAKAEGDVAVKEWEAKKA